MARLFAEFILLTGMKIYLPVDDTVFCLRAEQEEVGRVWIITDLHFEKAGTASPLEWIHIGRQPAIPPQSKCCTFYPRPVHAVHWVSSKGFLSSHWLYFRGYSEVTDGRSFEA